jgi:Ni/Co efflux regulator RcnB
MKHRLHLLFASALIASSAMVSVASAYDVGQDFHGDNRGDDHRGGDDHGRPGPPPHQWARGERMSDHYHGHVVVVNDYRSRHLRVPPRGYHWVRDDNNNLLLVAITTGVITDLVLNGR